MGYRGQTNQIRSKCKWSPYEGMTFAGQVTKTLLRGRVIFSEGQIQGVPLGQPLLYDYHKNTKNYKWAMTK
ncbi:hypothetical protein GCM10011571_33790 [Marinithermofilum abyssi]|uniref:Uncharacterized protein n=1 Tax=Marinithermofilum abyssi TaxID=1571185 RepID=A0A8J2YAC1_9BACL|nr:hypothetical protein GCM10011571_33790 [Marinithermofilum abyssi]